MLQYKDLRVRFAWTAALLIAAVPAAHAQDIVGDWQGSVKAGEAELRLVVHLAKDSSGALKGTMDSIDQGASGLPLSAVKLTDGKLSFVLEMANATYQGKVSADGATIHGAWTQGQETSLDLRRAAPRAAKAKPAKPSEIDGAWTGILDAGGKQLRFVFHIANTEDGLTATWDVPDQGANGIPVTTVRRDGDSLKLEMKAQAASFEGTIDKERTTIDGQYTQGASFPLVLKRIKDPKQL